MEVTLEHLRPEASSLSVTVQITSKMNVSAFVAKRKVTGFVADQISTNLHGGEPVLVIGDRIRWRVPVILSLPPIGERGVAGEIDVDVETGQLQISSELFQEIEDRAEHLVARTPHPTA